MLLKSYLGGMTLVGAAALVLAVLVMTATTPRNIGPLGVTAWFLLILVALMAVVTLIAYGLSVWLQPKLASKRRMRESLRRGLIVGGYTTVLLALNSLQQLNLRAVILLALLLILVEFYAVARA